MSWADVSSRDAILAAIEEYEHLGPDGFFAKYGYQEARVYHLVHNGKYYPSKAILGVSHGFQFPDLGPLKASEFSGGELTVKKKLEELGFEVQVFDSEKKETTFSGFIQGNIYIRKHLHDKYGGQRYGGISTPRGHNAIFIFTGEVGEQYGYSDGWQEERLFYYTGEGQLGDMELTKGNLAIAKHIEQGKDLHLFQYVDRGKVKFIDQMICIGYHEQTSLDKAGQSRKVIIFELTPLIYFTHDQSFEIVEEPTTDLTLGQLRQKALLSATTSQTPAERKSVYFSRSYAIKNYALLRANGICEGCGQPAPFITNAGEPYLEVHHLRRLTDGGPDHPEWVIAVCPNCHRQSHYSVDAADFNDALVNKVQEIENKIK